MIFSKTVLATALALAFISSHAWSTTPRMPDFMGMSVCVDKNDGIIPGKAPGDSGCDIIRKLRSGEVPPYQMNDFAAISDPCTQRLGVAARDNLPVTVDGVVRIVSFDWHASRAGCLTRGVPVLAELSIQANDAAYGFIMGDVSATGPFSFDSPALCRTAPSSSVRFSRGWVIAPTALPALGQTGLVTLSGTLTAGSPDSDYGHCPSSGQQYLTTWVFDTVGYTSGRSFPSVISNHYSHADVMGIAPGDARQMERTYWTKEFGLTRWEKWARFDWTGGTAPPATLARALYASLVCGSPYSMRGTVSAGLQMAPVAVADSYSQTLRDPRNATQAVWYMTDCADFTNIVRNPPASSTVVPNTYAGWWKN